MRMKRAVQVYLTSLSDEDIEADTARVFVLKPQNPIVCNRHISWYICFELHATQNMKTFNGRPI